MKNHRFWAVALLPLAFACQMGETEAPERAPLASLVVRAQVEAPVDETNTKVFMDNEYRLFWNAGDQISIFPQTTQNCAFTFNGADGDKSGTFSTTLAENGTAEAIALYCAAYPYRADNSVGTDGVLTLTLPAEQTYRANTFDPQAQLMAAVSSTPTFNFKNVGCVMAIQLYGAGVEVKSLSISGNADEILAGPMNVTAGDEPSFAFTQAATATTVTLTAETPVSLDATEPTRFWIVLPPVPFHSGFTLTVTDKDNRTFVKSTSHDIVLLRNHAHRMAALEVTFAPAIPTDEGFYLEGSEPYEFNPATDQVNLYEAENQVWARIITPGTLTVREIGPIPVSPVVGDSFDATYEETVAGVQTVSKAYTLEVLSLDNGILTLAATDQSYFVLRF